MSKTSPSMITVSAIVSTYNRAHYLPSALDSLLHQTRLPDEIIVVDDGSTDHTEAAAAQYGDRIRYLRQCKNRGKSEALNLAIPIAQGSHIWIFDDDDVALPDALQSHVNLLQSRSEVDFSYSTNYVFAGDGDIWERSKWKSKHLPSWTAEEFFIRQAFSMNAMLQGMLIPKRCFEQVGGFDTRLFRCQDLEMLLRLARRFAAQSLQKPTFVLREHTGTRGPARERHAEPQRAQIWLRYQRMIYREMRDKYPLSAYLRHAPGTDVASVDGEQRGQALLQRAAIMLQNGLTDEALSDMQAGLGLLRHTESGANPFKFMLSEAFDVDAWRLPKPYGFVRKATICLGKAKLATLRPAISRGLYWALNRSLRQHRWRDALHSAVMLGVSMLPLGDARE